MSSNTYLLMKDIHKKWKQGFKISNTQEFLSLIVLCSSENRSERISACKCVEYLLDWKIIEIKTTLNLLTSLASRTQDVDGVLAVSFNMISNLCENGEHYFLRNDLKVFLQSISNVISSNESSVPAILSLFDQLDINFVLQYFKPIVYDVVFGEHSNRNLAWTTFSKRIDLDLHRNFLIWLKFTRIEDCFLLLESLKTIPISKSEKCLHLSAVINYMLASGFNPKEAVNMLLAYISGTSIHIQSLALLTIVLGLETYSDLYIFVVLDLCDWFLKNTMLWKDVLWIILVTLIPLARKSVFYPNYQSKAKELISEIEKKDNLKSIELEFTSIDSIILKHVIYRHDCLHQSLILIRLLGQFINNDNCLMEWLKKFLNQSLDPTFKILQIIIGHYFLTRNAEIRKMCLSIFEKWKIESMDLYIFQLIREDDPSVILEIIRTLSTKRTSDGNLIVHDFLSKLSEEKHESCFNLEIDLIKKSSTCGYKLDDTLHILLNNKVKFSDVLGQATLVKSISSDLNIHFDISIPFCNNIINTAREHNGTIATSMVIDAVAIMCEKGVLDISILWNNLLAIVAGDHHPAVHNSVCNLLSKVPHIIKANKDYNQILYKSARVLWYFINTPSANKELAIRSLREYDLDIFDATFLSEECKTHLKYPVDESVIPKIQGHCWLHLINDYSLADLFVYYINKKFSKARFYGSYSSLFESVVNYLNVTELSDVKQITICLKILSANWTRVPAGMDISCIERFLLESGTQEIRELSLLVILNFFPTNDSARNTFESFILRKNYSERDKAIICLLPDKFLEKHREINEHILFEGLLYGLNTELFDGTSGAALNTKIEESLVSCAKNASVSASKRRIIMKVLISLWTKLPFKHEVFKSVSKVLTAAYGYALLKSLPYNQFKGEICHKFIYLCRQIVLKTKSLYCFDSAITVGQRNESMQEDVLENFLHILHSLGEEKRSNNIKWILRILCTTAINGNDFMCKILVYGINFLSGTATFSLSITLRESLSYFPLAISTLSRISGKGKYIILTLNELIHKTEKVHPVFIEVFKLGIMRIRDEPMISYDAVIRKTLE